MAVNVIVSSAEGPGIVTSVPDGGALHVAPGMTVRVELVDTELDLTAFVEPGELDTTMSNGDATLTLPDGQTVVLTGYGEALMEQALGAGLSDTAPAGQIFEQDQILGPKVSIDYQGEGLEVSRVDLFFDKHEGLDVDALFAALETELGLRPPADDGAPNITGMNVIEQPLDLSDLLVESSGTLSVAEASGGKVIGTAPAFADMASLWGGEEEGLAVNDNDVMISA